MNDRTDAARSQSSHRSIRIHVAAGLATVLLLVAGVGGWAMTTELSGAVVAQGVLVVDSSVKKVQHPSGGVVGELRVRDGDHVEADELLVRLDDTVMRSNLAMVVKGLAELAARQARLEAERDGADAVTFPERLGVGLGDADGTHIIEGERKLFELRRTARAGQKAQLRERVAQLREEMVGLGAQSDAKRREIELMTRELDAVRDLWHKNLVPISRVTAVERDAVRLGGERGQLIANLAQAKGKIAEIELQIIQIDQDLHSEVAKDMAEIRAKTAELVERRVAADDQLKRVDIRAPQRGTVHQLAVHTIGGVVSAGETLMLVVPEGDELTVEAKIPPQDIDQVALGGRAALRFSAFNQRTTPEIFGQVSEIAADITQDPKTGVPFYTLRISIPANELARLDGLHPVPGMPVEAYVQSASRTMMSYLVKPLRDQVSRAFRER